MNSMLNILRKIHIHPLFWIVMGVAVITARFYEMLTLLFILFVHEMGHGIMAHFFSWRIKKISILPFGGVAEMDEHGNRPLKEEFLVILAGPLQHVWLGALAFLLWSLDAISSHLFHMFMEFNVMILLFNLLPIWPLDGGKLLQLLFSRHIPYLQAFRLSILSSFIFLVLFHLISLFLSPFNLNIWVVVIYLYVSLWLEWKQIRYVFIRFLLERYYGRKNGIKGLKPIVVDSNAFLFEVLEQFQRGSKHPLIVENDGQEMGKLDENELLHAYFAEKMVTAKIKDIMYVY
ncbi:M50 family metallopeptidase [Bacillus sp. FJAT-49736]|uniref:M50 family metallopeptidase n=1 Tax=Bacillus sp. FJAT-49736 TaxID=2833582 RepID=UPI002016490B|nr:M50 family metallopeptidase [Bacillus sp. FJAT-49736]